MDNINLGKSVYMNACFSIFDMAVYYYIDDSVKPFVWDFISAKFVYSGKVIDSIRIILTMRI